MNNSRYELLRELGQSPGFFTDQLKAEFLGLAEQLRSGVAGPDFPWERYEELGFSKMASELPDDWRKMNRELNERLIQEGGRLHRDILRHNSIAITVANADWHNSVGMQHKVKIDLLNLAIEQAERQEAFCKKLFAGCASSPTLPTESVADEASPLPTTPPAPAPLTVADPRQEGFTPADVLALSIEGGLAPTERILAPGFTLVEVDRLALAVGLIDTAGKYCLGRRKLGAIVGFCLALQYKELLVGTVPELTAALGPHWDTTIKTRKNNNLARKYAALTEKALKCLKPTD